MNSSVKDAALGPELVILLKFCKRPLRETLALEGILAASPRRLENIFVKRLAQDQSWLGRRNPVHQHGRKRETVARTGSGGRKSSRLALAGARGIYTGNANRGGAVALGIRQVHRRSLAAAPDGLYEFVAATMDGRECACMLEKPPASHSDL